MSEREGFAYTALFCEENVWHLCADARVRGGRRHVVFISNPGRTCALWAQRAAPAGDPVVWDYHVVLIAESEAGAQVYDLDSTLPVPVPLADYLAATFPLPERVPQRLRPRFRVVDAHAFRGGFSTDRSHMPAHVPRPAWSCPRAPRSSMNLAEYVEMEAHGPGEVVDLAGLLRRFEG